MNKKFYGLGRSRSSNGKGEIIKRRLNPYVNCIHTLAGAGYETMAILVVEVYEEIEESDGWCSP